MSSRQSLVSIIVATYNGEKYLLEQLNSIANQTYKNIEIIICDDASKDSTCNIIKAFAQNHTNASYHINETNKGVNKNFEEGFLKAAGDFIAIADQDDIWLPEKIETQMALFTAKEIVLTHSISVRFSGNNLPIKKQQNITQFFEGNDVRKLLLRNSVSGHNIIFRQELLKQITPIPINIYYDWWIVQTAACNGSIAATNKVLAYQRAHETNVTVKKRTTVNQSTTEYEERKTALKAFIQLKGLKNNDKKFIEETLAYFMQLENTNFSQPLFSFLLKNRNIFFFYKKGLFKYFSQRKAAKKMSYKVIG
jgi:glycosyltransferase involved in cell wall biosynthesis